MPSTSPRAWPSTRRRASSIGSRPSHRSGSVRARHATQTPLHPDPLRPDPRAAPARSAPERAFAANSALSPPVPAFCKTGVGLPLCPSSACAAVGAAVATCSSLAPPEPWPGPWPPPPQAGILWASARSLRGRSTRRATCSSQTPYCSSRTRSLLAENEAPESVVRRTRSSPACSEAPEDMRRHDARTRLLRAICTRSCMVFDMVSRLGGRVCSVSVWKMAAREAESSHPSPFSLP